MSGAVDFSECPKQFAWKSRCCCGICAVCGYPKHTAVHGPVYGQPPGSKPYDHEYQPPFAEAPAP